MASKNQNHPLTVTVEGGTLVVRIGVNVLAHAAALSDWANPFNEATDNHQREFAITDAKLFAKEVARALEDEREDGSSLLTDVLDKASEDAVSDGAESCEFDDVVLVHGHFDPRETWARAEPPARECAGCAGRGVVGGYEPVEFGNTLSAHPVDVPCPDCKGSGETPAPQVGAFPPLAVGECVICHVVAPFQTFGCIGCESRTVESAEPPATEGQ